VFDGALDERVEDRQVDVGETLDVEAGLARPVRAERRRELGRMVYAMRFGWYPL
jgi:hypothetical protein